MNAGDFDSTADTGKHHLVPVFLFHNLDGDGKYAITRQEFRTYLNMIRESGVDVISLKTLLEHARKGKMFSRPSVVITIDDDYKNIARVAAPLLREYQFPATIFVYLKDINNHPRGGMSWDDLRRLHKEGFEIQNHSWSHGIFHKPASGESWEAYSHRVDREIVESKVAIEKNIPGNKVYAFAFPMGYYSDYLKERVTNEGYDVMMTVDGDPVDVLDSFNGIFDRYTIGKGDLQKYRKRFLHQLELAHSEHEMNARVSVK